MSEGMVVYHGPLRNAVPFFESFGFVMPARKDAASFLQEVTTVKGQVCAHRYTFLVHREQQLTGHGRRMLSARQPHCLH